MINKKLYFLRFFQLFCGLLLSSTMAIAQDLPDTVWVNTFNFSMPNPQGGYGGGEQYKGSFQFPAPTESFQKILMYYTLKCDAATNQDQYPCGEWDYLSYTHLIDSTGLYDSTRRTQVNYSVKGETPNTFSYTSTPTYTTYNETQTYLNVSNTLGGTSHTIGTATANGNIPLGLSHNRNRTQFIISQSEMIGMGMAAGNITAMRFPLFEGAADLTDFTIAMKNTNQSAFPDGYSEPMSGGFTTVYHHNNAVSAAATNEATYYFTTPFAWNGTSDIVVDISYNGNGVNSLQSYHSTEASVRCIATQQDNHHLDLATGDYIEVPVNNLANIGQEVTVMFWSYGDPAEMPTTTYAFEAVDAQNRRVLNVHLPWSDNVVYWDAGHNQTSSYDRINKSAGTASEGGWHHWAFVKNATTGSMQIYLDGTLWHSGAGKTKSMAGITKFRIARGFNEGWMYYHGSMDEFAVFNKALDATTIHDWKNRHLNNTHPNYSNLLVYYPFDETSGSIAQDASGNNNDGTMMGYPAHRTTKAADSFLDLLASNTKPHVILEQNGVYDFTTETSLWTYTEPNPSVSVILYDNPANGTIVAEDAPNHPTIPTDTLSVWQADAYTYTYTDGIATDSVLVAAEQSLARQDKEYYSGIVQFEIGRFITPYGINLDLGANGFTWIYDVTDYAPLLRGSKYIRSGNAQELHDLRFAFIRGLPARDVVGVKNLWNGSFGYANIQNNTACTPITTSLPTGAASARVKMRTTGHGMESSENCAEFCYKNHQIKVDGVTRFTQLLKRECAFNPVYPQGGTWIYDRANWCPGDVVPTFDVDITPYISPDEPFAVDYGIQATGTPQGNWVIETQMISYSSYRFANDVAIEEIVSPSMTQYHSRRNPICDGPVVRIRNNGSEVLYNCMIHYGVKDGLGFGTFPSCYQWFGELRFGEVAEVKLPQMNWSNFDPNNPVFFVTVDSPNSQTDEYSLNNRAESRFEAPPRYDSGMIFQFKGNARSLFQNSYTLKDAFNNIITERQTINNNATYNDVFTLDPGCYVLEFLDEEEASGAGNNGLSWWAASGEGNGNAKLKAPNGTTYITFDPDFGGSIYHQFLIGYDLPNMPYNNDLPCEAIGIAHLPTNNGMISVYPSPTTDNAMVDFVFEQATPVTIKVYNALGQMVFSKQYDYSRQATTLLPLPDAKGLYFVQITTPKHSLTRTVVKQ